MSDAFQRAIRAVRSSDVPHDELGDVFLGVLPVRGVSVSTFGEPAGNETIAATDRTAFQVDELQFDDRYAVRVFEDLTVPDSFAL